MNVKYFPVGMLVVTSQFVMSQVMVVWVSLRSNVASAETISSGRYPAVKVEAGMRTTTEPTGPVLAVCQARAIRLPKPTAPPVKVVAALLSPMATNDLSTGNVPALAWFEAAIVPTLSVTKEPDSDDFDCFCRSSLAESRPMTVTRFWYASSVQ